MGGKRLSLPRQKRLPDALSEEQIRRLLTGIRNPIHRTCLATIYSCGLRIGEATTLEISAVDRARQVLHIIGKGNKERLVHSPFSMTSAASGDSIITGVGCSPIGTAMHHSVRVYCHAPSPLLLPWLASSPGLRRIL